ncbi:hypothetical protein [Paracoccus hibiscisoli]|uniref:hypothetical protein n=1 Tax=Paracoccus hibiscisoli TaxID=2023261 RepID=UPI00391C21DF
MAVLNSEHIPSICAGGIQVGPGQPRRQAKRDPASVAGHQHFHAQEAPVAVGDVLRQGLDLDAGAPGLPD